MRTMSCRADRSRASTRRIHLPPVKRQSNACPEPIPPDIPSGLFRPELPPPVIWIPDGNRPFPAYRSIIVLVLGKRLPRPDARMPTREGCSRCRTAAAALPKLRRLAPHCELFLGASGYRNEGELFVQYLRHCLDEVEIPTTCSQPFVESCARNTSENCLFSRAVIDELDAPHPRCWVLVSTDNHLESLEFKRWVFGDEFPHDLNLLPSKGDAVALLPAPFPYRNCDPGREFICRVIDLAFLAAPLQANLYGLKAGFPHSTEVLDDGTRQIAEHRYWTNQVFPRGVALLGHLINELLRLERPLTKVNAGTTYPVEVDRVRGRLLEVVDHLTWIHSELAPVAGVPQEAGWSVENWGGVNLMDMLVGINRFIQELRWASDPETNEEDRRKLES